MKKMHNFHHRWY